MAEAQRECLRDVSTADDVIALLRTRKNIIVISGAGISVSCGIPDFRSKEGGLYNTLDCAAFGIPSAELLFDLEFFEIDPQPFYKFASSLLPSDTQPSASHRFLEVLSGRKKLLRNYTQNVDGLERKLRGVPTKQVIECHGSMAQFRCTKCRCKPVALDADLSAIIRSGQVAFCRSSKCSAVLKPNITFFGEALPAHLYRAIEEDLPRCDLVIVMGTSLKVGGSVLEIVRRVDRRVPLVLINKECVKLPAFSQGFDVSLLGQCDEVMHFLCQRLGWEGLSDDPAFALPAQAAVGGKRKLSQESSRSTSSSSRSSSSSSSSESNSNNNSNSNSNSSSNSNNISRKSSKSGARSDRTSANSISISGSSRRSIDSSPVDEAILTCEEVSNRVYRIS